MFAQVLFFPPPFPPAGANLDINLDVVNMLLSGGSGLYEVGTLQASGNLYYEIVVPAYTNLVFSVVPIEGDADVLISQTNPFPSYEDNTW